jgi:hypothetical protein
MSGSMRSRDAVHVTTLIAVVHPRDMEGVLVELVQLP